MRACSVAEAGVCSCSEKGEEQKTEKTASAGLGPPGGEMDGEDIWAAVRRIMAG